MQNLRSKFNPDGSLLRKHQLRMLEVLKYIDGICQKNDIKYWLSSGTLLGAVRHKGFIPWDDDLDIEMLRSDYIKLLNILYLESSDLYQIQTNKTDPNYFFTFAKLRDKNSLLYEKNDCDLNFNYRGIYIDIFPLEVNKYPLSKVLTKCHMFICRNISKKNKFKCVFFKSLYFAFDNIVFPFFRFLYKFMNDKVLNHTFGVFFYKSRYRKDIFPLTKIEFEGEMFPSPYNAHKYLTSIYGDYMKIPPIESITVHTNRVELF